MKPLPILLAGEVLFDCFPDNSQVLGGAPFNVAWHLKALGANPLFISRVGDDAQGQAIIEAMRAWEMDLSALTIDSKHPTGRVSITLEQGEPSYVIEPDQAYDFIAEDTLPALPDDGFFYHGSLALRGETSRATLERLGKRHAGRVFMDVNLRAPWWRKSDLLTWLNAADWVKLNLDELKALAGLQADPAAALSAFIDRHGLTGAVLTLGADGALARLAGDARSYRVRPEQNLAVVDAVGAGDAFAAVFLLGLSRGWDMQETLNRAQSLASRLVTRRGATVSDPAFYQSFLNQWSR